MKKFIPCSFLLAALTTGVAFSQTTAYTTPVGYSTQALKQGYNVVGLTLQNTPVASGAFEVVNGTALTDSEVTFAPTAGRTYILEITSGTLAGTSQDVLASAISGNVITTPAALTGVATGDTYNLRLAPTIEEVFTTTSLSNGGVLASALNSTNADVVLVPTGTGTYNQYYLKSGATPAFYKAGSTTIATPNVPIVYMDGLLVQKKATTAASLTVSGEVKKVGTNVVMVQGYNLLGTVAPVGLNLDNSGLATSIAGSLSATNADIVWVQQSDLSYKKYFRSTSSGGSWRDVAAPSTALTPTQAQAISLPSAVLIQRKSGAPATVKFGVPTAYTSL